MTILWFLALALLIYLVFHYGTQLLVSWLANRTVAKALSPATPRVHLDPESRFVIQMTDSAVSCHRPDVTVESVRWDDLQKVELLTNGDGPLLPDRFWLLHGSGKGGCCIPWGATGDLELLRRLQELPGFDNLALLKPTGSTQEALFVCWQRLTNQS